MRNYTPFKGILFFVLTCCLLISGLSVMIIYAENFKVQVTGGSLYVTDAFNDPCCESIIGTDRYSVHDVDYFLHELNTISGEQRIQIKSAELIGMSMNARPLVRINGIVCVFAGEVTSSEQVPLDRREALIAMRNVTYQRSSGISEYSDWDGEGIIKYYAGSFGDYPYFYRLISIGNTTGSIEHY